VHRRRRQIGLFFIAAVLPAIALSVLTFRFLAQNQELDRQRNPERRRQAVEQAQRELENRLEAIRLEEINRRVTTSGSDTRLANPAIVFVATLDKDSFVFPWEQSRKTVYPTPAFVSNKETGEVREFQSKDFNGAAASYRLAADAAATHDERCEARLGAARVLVKAARAEEAAEVYRQMLLDCGQAIDDAGMPFTLYAADRLIALKLDARLARQFLLQQIYNVRLRPLAQTLMMRSLLQSLQSESPEDVDRALTETNTQITDLQRAIALKQEFPQLRTSAEKQWITYGHEPWLLKVTSSPALSPLVFAVSSGAVAPMGAKLSSVKTRESYALDGFPGLEIELDPSRFAGSPTPAALIAVGVGMILVLTFLSGYLLLHGVNRDLQMAELRSQFVASVSHELKTPLTAIRMFAETLVLGRTRDETARAEYLETIMSESERLARLVDNVLDFSKIEQGKKIYRMRPTAVSDVARSAARAMEYPLSQQGFELNVSIDDTLPTLAADSDALEQAILNLLSNAMKYSGDARRIDLCCSRANEHVNIAVTDRGIGIAPADQPHIFEKFYRVRSSATDLIAGTGLGLTLVRHIAVAHGGSVAVESAPGKGSTFSIRIPVPPEASA
jgi:signal transduction histidine kinase